jgi:hypothetical protein
VAASTLIIVVGNVRRYSTSFRSIHQDLDLRAELKPESRLIELVSLQRMMMHGTSQPV